MLEVRGISKSFGDTLALAPLDLRFTPGETTALIGPSGCGKSTLLKLLMGIISPDSGEVLIDGTPLTPENAQAQRRKLGYVIQDGGLFPHLTCEENVTLMARHLAWKKDAIQARLSKLRTLVQLDATSLSRYPKSVSGGQAQRVGLMRALFLNPDALLLDEPLGALDPLVRRDLQEELKAIFEGLGKTVVLVTHDMAEAAFFGDRIALLREGHLCQLGTLRDLLDHPAEPFVQRFIEAQRGPKSLLQGEG